jgi:hypothetical protein
LRPSCLDNKVHSSAQILVEIPNSDRNRHLRVVSPISSAMVSAKEPAFSVFVNRPFHFFEDFARSKIYDQRLTSIFSFLHPKIVFWGATLVDSHGDSTVNFPGLAQIVFSFLDNVKKLNKLKRHEDTIVKQYGNKLHIPLNLRLLGPWDLEL